MKHKMKLSFWAKEHRAAKQVKSTSHAKRRHFLVYSALILLLVSITLPLLSPLEAQAVGQSNIAQNAKLKATWSAIYLHKCLNSWGNWKAVNGSDIINFNWSYGFDASIRQMPTIGGTGTTDCTAQNTKYAFSNLTTDNGGQILCKMGFKQSQYIDVDYGCLPSDKTWYQSKADGITMDQLSINPGDFRNGGTSMSINYNASAVIDKYAQGKTISFDTTTGKSPAFGYAWELSFQTAGGQSLSSTQSSKYTTPVTIWSYDNNKNAYYSEQWYTYDIRNLGASILDNNGKPSADAQAFYTAVGAKTLAEADKAATLAAAQTQCEALFPAPTSSGTAGEYDNQARNRKIAACVDGATNKSSGHCESVYLGQDTAGTKDTKSTYEKNYGDAVAKELENACLQGQGVEIPTDSGVGDSLGQSETDPCAAISNFSPPMSWLACAVFTAITQMTSGMQSTMTDILYTPADTLFQDSSTFKKTSDIFRNIGMALIVITGLIMIIAQATSLEIIDAYTIKKVLPRLGIALVGMAIAWPLLKLSVTLSNDLAFGVRDLFNNFAPTIAGKSGAASSGDTIGAAITTFLAGAGVMGTLGVWGAILLAASLIVSYLTGLIVLFMQKILLILLILVAPLAIASSVLPGTEKLWKLWRSNLLKVLAMFTVIIAIIKIGDVVAAVAFAANTPLIAFGAKAASLVLTFKAPQFTGQMLGGIMGMASNAAYKMAASAKAPIDNFRKQNTKQRNQQMLAGTRFNDSSRIGHALNKAGRFTKEAADLRTNRLSMDRIRAAMNSGDHDAATKFMQEDAAFGAIKGDDAKLWASQFRTREQISAELERRDADRFGGAHNARAREDAVSEILRAQRGTNRETFNRARVRAQAATGTGYQYKDSAGNTQVDVSRMLDDINSAYGDDRAGAQRAVAEMRGALTNSGQIAGQASFGTWAALLDERRNGTVSNQDANNRIFDDAIDSVQPSHAIYGKPSSAAQMGAAHARRIQAISDGIVAGTRTQEDLDAATSAAAGLLDAMGQASPQNASAFANELMGVTITGSGQQQTVTTPAVPGPNGTTMIPATTTTSTGPDLTVRDMIDDRMGNPQYRQRRRDWASAAAAQSNNQQTQAQTQAHPTPTPPPGQLPHP